MSVSGSRTSAGREGRGGAYMSRNCGMQHEETAAVRASEASWEWHGWLAGKKVLATVSSSHALYSTDE
eukprot:3590296-Rhodomonas_salina.1